MRIQSLWSATVEVFNSFFEDNAFLLAAALSFYTLLSMAPLLIVLIAVGGLIWGEQAARGQLQHQIERAVGPDAAQTIESVLANASGPGSGSALGMIVGIVATLVGATTVFAQLQTALNQIWDVKAMPRNAVLGYLKTRLTALGLVLVVVFLLVVSLVASAALSLMQSQLSQALPALDWLWQVSNVLVTLALFGVLLAMIFRYLPDVQIAWRHVWTGAGVTTVLLVAGKFLIGMYLGMAGVGSAYGAAGSLAVLLVWVYYSSLIVFLGAEITQVVARRSGDRIEPSSHAVRVVEQEQPKPGGQEQEAAREDRAYTGRDEAANAEQGDEPSNAEQRET